MRQAVRSSAMMLTCLLVLVSLTGCGQREDKLDEVRAAIAATRRNATQFVYTDAREHTSTTVAGAIEDDFRFKALTTYDGQPAFEEIVRDDALALRFHDPNVIGKLVDPTRIDTADTSTELDGITAIQALQSKRWVIDPAGAPAVTAFGTAATDIGADPVFDAITSLRYVETALVEAFSVDEWRADALNPTYTKSEDAFPKPEEGSGVIRYDLRRLFLPAAGDAGGAGGQRSLASTKNFRKMAIYVKDGRVIRVLERIEVTGKMIDTVVDYTRALLKESRAPDDLVRQFERLAAGVPNEALGRQLLTFLNGLLEQLGVAPVLARTMSLEFKRGEGTIAVDLPQADVIKGSLEVMLASAAAKAPDVGDAGGGPTTTAPSGTPTTIGTGDAVPGDGTDEAPPGDGESSTTTIPDSSTTSLPIIQG